MAGKDRKKQLARQRYERQQQRRAEEAARARRLKIIGSAAAVAVVAAGGGVFMVVTGDEESTAAGPKCDYKTAQAPAAKDVGKPPGKPAYTGTVQATVKTNRGDVEMQLFGEKAPCTVNSFAFLAQKNYFDKSPCHRLTSGGLNVLQCGDPTGKGTGGPGYEFDNENTKGATYTEGTLAMANSGPDTNGSQFFLVYKDSQLDPDYTVFGKITKGLDVLTKVAADGSEPKGDGAPKKKVEIEDVAIAGK
ncbi:peptidyl-prolyl cis-trans isomerase B (cyclophilin B) [Actinomadura pelletieri DSM 43383]|uniref:Peptidyl-prolyl cis-trans isomerase n=1 Tax=Actinomadura pelletieri DSM 43383 TaxID=1120940 RepID=A0A495Q939_9ACTN|nr:peptidylprolyl isomerase [Actinomadura pelletieri]RKS67828.1 peptidyl-prolyl cis-trans isomerase B (cyclophilin B) [Actinomadura pelletieri DSM 43383]